MNYTYVPPRAEEHKVDWYHRDMPGLFQESRPAFSYLIFTPEMAGWLDSECPGWSFRSDWDYSNGGDDDEGCHLRVSNEAQAQAFIAKAKEVSAAWVAADRLKMPFRAYLVRPGSSPEASEIARAHNIHDLRGRAERALTRMSADRRTPIRATRKFYSIETYPHDLEFEADPNFPEGTVLRVDKVEVA